MSIMPLPQFEKDLKADREAYKALKPPTSIVVRFGVMKLVGEFPYKGDAKPGCGSKIVLRSHRGVELGEMLTSTCANAGCSKSVTRQEMLEYIENSGGREYPFFTRGKIIRIATVEDIQRESANGSLRQAMVKKANERAEEVGLEMKVIEAEPILGGETLTFYFRAEDRVDFRDLVRALAEDYQTRIELRQVGARDEARITADYERCGQHCCCKQFLKVLKPVSMRSAKVQKSTLDPLKISGRCGRLMCCLRYEDETYESLRKKLPKRGKRVGTPEGAGKVIDAQILTQLVLVALEDVNERIAVAVEDLCDPDNIPKKKPEPDPLRGIDEREAKERTDDRGRRRRSRGSKKGESRTKDQQQDAYREQAKAQPEGADGAEGSAEAAPKKKRRRRGKRGRSAGGQAAREGQGGGGQQGERTGSGRADGERPAQNGDAASSDPAKKKRRRGRGGRRGKKGRGRRGDGPRGDGGGSGGSGGGEGG